MWLAKREISRQGGQRPVDKKASPARAAEPFVLEPDGSRGELQRCVRLSAAVGGPAHGTDMLVPRVVDLRLKGVPGFWRTQQEMPFDSILNLLRMTRSHRAAMGAVSVRRVRGPSRRPMKPYWMACRISSLLRPPSGPTRRVTLVWGGWSAPRFSPSAGFSTSLRPEPAWFRASSSGVISRSSGSRFRPHCSQALMTISRQWRSRFSARSLASRTTQRWVSTGVMVVTPSSVAFWTTWSIRSPFDTPCSR